jgi:hypothetical protein
MEDDDGILLILLMFFIVSFFVGITWFLIAEHYRRRRNVHIYDKNPERKKQQLKSGTPGNTMYYTSKPNYAITQMPLPVYSFDYLPTY